MEKHVSFESQYLSLVEGIIGKRGSEDRPPAREGMPKTRATFGVNLVARNVAEYFPLLTTKQIGIKNVVAELAWFLRGDTNIKSLKADKCNIWDEDAYKHHKRIFSSIGKEHLTMEEFLHHVENEDEIKVTSDYSLGDLGESIYGGLWRNFDGVDQIAKIVSSLVSSPYSRYHVLTAWSPSTLHTVALPPCHILAQFFCRGENAEILDVQFYMRSIDLGLGLPYNIASYSALLIIMAEMTGKKAGDVFFVGGDAHVYEDHFEKLLEQTSRDPYVEGQLDLKDDVKEAINKSFGKWATGEYASVSEYVDDVAKNIINRHSFEWRRIYQHRGKIELKLSVGV